MEPKIKVSILAFFESYIRAFERQDPELLADHMAYPCHVAGDDVTVFAARADYVKGIAPLLGVYRKFDVATAHMIVDTCTVFSESLAQIVIHWHAKNSAARTLYSFEASYTLVRSQDRWAIAALAFNEFAKIRALRAS